MSSAPLPTRATVLGSFLEGGRRVWQAPAVWLGVSVLAVAVLAPFSGDLFGHLSDSLGLRTALQRAIWEWHAGWALALGGRLPPPAPAVAGAALVALSLSLFLTGGILDRFARGRATYSPAFFSACGTHLWRFLRLQLLFAPVYYALFIWVWPWLTGTVLSEWMERAGSPREVLRQQWIVHSAFVALMGLIGLVADFSRVRIVVEDRHSALGGLMAALRFLRRRPLRSTGVYALSALPTIVVIRWWFGAMSFGEGGLVQYVVVVVLYLTLRMVTRLWWMAACVVFFQGELAHATYTAAPLPLWPDSPTAEGLANLRAGARRDPVSS